MPHGPNSRNTELVASAAATIVICDRTWWAAEAPRRGTDWDGIIEAHLDILALLGLVQREASK
jgi:hypothetical protein